MSTEPTPLHKNPKFLFAAGTVAVAAGLLVAHLIENGQFVKLIEFVAGAYLAGGG